MGQHKYMKAGLGKKQLQADRSARNFALLLHKHIPSFVSVRLSPIKEKLRNSMQGYSETERVSLREEISIVAAPLNDEIWKDWTNKFQSVFAKKGETNFTDSLSQIPDPPVEPVGLWSRLAMQAEKLGNEGIAACLGLYTLACARALREFRVIGGYVGNDNKPNLA